MDYSNMLIFQQPRCLITSSKDGILEIENDVLDEVSKIKDRLVIIAIVGLYRTGKSFLMNRLAQSKAGFPLGKTIRSETKGIWIWCKQHPTQPNTVMMLIDTEGLGDIEKGDTNHDNKIFTLSLLMCDVLCYNIMCVFDKDAIEKLVTISGIIHNRFGTSHTEFVLCVRDFSLQLVKDGKEITEDEYLEYCLRDVTATEEAVLEPNKAKSLIKEMFPHRKCFTFDRPVSEKKQLLDLQSLHENELSHSFVEDGEKFVKYIYSRVSKVVSNDCAINGKLFSSLLVRYVDTIRSGVIPDIQDALRRVIEKENEDLVQVTKTKFSNDMDMEINGQEVHSSKTVGILADGTILNLMNYFRSKVKDDSDNKFKTEAMDELMKLKEEKIQTNRMKIKSHCKASIEKLYKRGVAGGLQFRKIGGREAYRKRLTEVIEKYQTECGHLDVEEVEAVLKMFINDKSDKEFEIIVKEAELKKMRDQKFRENNIKRRAIQEKKTIRKLGQYTQREKELRKCEKKNQRRALREFDAKLDSQQRELRGDDNNCPFGGSLCQRGRETCNIL